MLSILVCTHNRAGSLRRTLDRLMALEPAGEFEVVVVDNRSCDATREVVSALSRRTAPLRYVYESKLGLSHALNRGVREARGEVVAFIDDDETVPENWLEAILAAFQDPRTDLIFSRLYQVDEAGRRMPKPRPGFPERDYGAEPIVVTEKDRRRFIFGTGISAYRTAVLRDIGAFRTDLGRKGTRLLGGEDTDMYERFLRAGRRVLYWPDAVVYHHVDAHRRTRWYALIKSFDGGITRARMRPLPEAHRLLGLPVSEVRGFLHIGREFLAACLRSKAEAWYELNRLTVRLGLVWGYATMRAQRSRE